MSVRVVLGEISAKDATTRAAIPTTSQGVWPPFERVAETIATPRRRFPPHRHVRAEVLTYIIEGSGTYEVAPEAPIAVAAGATGLLTAPTSLSHSINPGQGQTIRWFGVVATLPPAATASAGVQYGQAVREPGTPDGAMAQRLIGAGSGILSAVGLECEVIEFPSTGTTFRKVGHDRIAVCYALAGRGGVDNQAIEIGEAALVEDAAGIAVHGKPGFRVIITSAPRTA
jgi:redox-sensitive bicupin YhaK (pirin superfamily)